MRIYWKIKDWWFDVRMWWQRKTRGYSDIEVWNLDNTICEWILPRLRVLRKDTIGYPNVPGECESLEDWKLMIDEMIFGFEWAQKEGDWYRDNVMFKSGKERDTKMSLFKSHCKRAQHGRELFGKYFTHLWW